MRRRVATGAFGITMLVLICVSISVGDVTVPLGDVIRVLLGGGDADAAFVVRTLRLPRALTAAMVGAAFGLSGAMFQAIARNPLASPDIVGITSGASAGAVVVIVALAGGAAATATGALVGGLAAAVVIGGLAHRGALAPGRVVLVGIGVSAMLMSVTSFLLTRGQLRDVQRATVWLTGSLNGRTWDHVRVLGAMLMVLVPIVALLSDRMRTLQLGDEVALALGVHVHRSRLALLAAAVGLAAAATAAAGPVAFVAFVAAPIARRATRSPLAPAASALCGAVLVLAADLAARRIVAPTELPVGVVTAMLGAPALLIALVRSRRITATG